MTAFCQHPGCLAALHRSNLSGVCRDHMHGVACRCAGCRAHPTAAQRSHAFAQAVASTAPKGDPDLPLTHANREDAP
jgi:hypothetical protein